MAKDNTKDSKLTDKEKREKTRKEKQVREQKDADQKKKDKLKRQKIRDQKRKKLLQAERKRVNKIINFPFNTLTQISLLTALIAFVIQFVSSQFELLPSAVNSFLVFIALYIGIGMIMATVFYILSVVKQKDIADKIIEEETRIKEENKQKELDDAKLNEERRLKEMQRNEELQKFREAQLKADKKSTPMITPPSEDDFLVQELNKSPIIDDVELQNDFDNKEFVDFDKEFDLNDFSEKEFVNNN